MIVGKHAVIRTSDPDDAVALKRLYDPEMPRSALLDHRRELVEPTLDELREAMAHKEMSQGGFHAIEDKSGEIRGFCAVRSINPEAAFGEIVLVFADPTDYTVPIAEETLAFLLDQAFVRLRLRKVVAHALESESALRLLLERSRFSCDGSQREAVYTLGRRWDLSIYSRFREDIPTGPRP